MSNVYLPATPVTPLYMLITAITQSNPMIVTAQIPNLYILPPTPNTYQEGQLVRLSVPDSYGMFQADGLTGRIQSVVGQTFTLAIDSTGFDIFAVPTGRAERPATFSPAGARNLDYNNFTNAVPFRSATNTGN